MRLPEFFRLTFEVRGNALAPQETYRSLLEISNTEGDVVLGVYTSPSRNLMYLYNGAIELSEGPEVSLQYNTEWTAVSVLITPLQLITFSSTDPSDIFTAPLTWYFPTFNKVFSLYASSPYEGSAGGMIRNVNITGKA